ncbi:MAG: EpsG family protein [Bacteroidia bacterium]|mgnify:FL=1|nr:EpsG family protein [Bacteroidia bacterium]MCW5919518.1 EpsG family protein [Bacteroidota bacterium]MCC7513930.1 EpsG family protein [Bacteroidia bacterium]HMU76656.1 EpsG family protein [Bacteroidia bacterium]HMX96672.1 EpsG family protein [Bacteroidia bacterium]
MYSVSKQFYIILILIASIIFFITGFLRFDGLYGQDAYSYLLQCKNLFSENYRLNFYPPVYAFSGWLLHFIFHDFAISLQLVSLISVIVTTILIRKIILIQSRNEQHAFVFSIVFFLLSPFILRSSVIVMSDALAMMFCTVCLYFQLKQKESSVFFVCLFFLLAILTRYAAAPLLLPVLFYSLLRALRRKQFVYLLGGIGIIIVGFGLNALFWSNASGSVNHQWLHLWKFVNIFRSSFNTPDGIQDYLLPNILYVFKLFVYPGFIPLFLFLLFFIQKNELFNRKMILPTSSLLLYFIFLCGIPFQNDRFLLIAFPFASIIMFPSFSRLMERFKPPLWIVVVVCIVHVVLACRAILPMYHRNIIETEIANALKPYQGKVLYSFDMDVALKGRGLNFDFKNLLDTRYQSFEESSLMLFNEKKMGKQWAGRNPMINFNEAKSSYLLTVESELNDGWILYLVQKSKTR